MINAAELYQQVANALGEALTTKSEQAYYTMQEKGLEKAEYLPMLGPDFANRRLVEQAQLFVEKGEEEDLDMDVFFRTIAMVIGATVIARQENNYKDEIAKMIEVLEDAGFPLMYEVSRILLFVGK